MRPAGACRLSDQMTCGQYAAILTVASNRVDPRGAEHHLPIQGLSSLIRGQRLAAETATPRTNAVRYAP